MIKLIKRMKEAKITCIYVSSSEEKNIDNVVVHLKSENSNFESLLKKESFSDNKKYTLFAKGNAANSLFFNIKEVDPEKKLTLDSITVEYVVNSKNFPHLRINLDDFKSTLDKSYKMIIRCYEPWQFVVKNMFTGETLQFEEVFDDEDLFYLNYTVPMGACFPIYDFATSINSEASLEFIRTQLLVAMLDEFGEEPKFELFKFISDELSEINF